MASRMFSRDHKQMNGLVVFITELLRNSKVIYKADLGRSSLLKVLLLQWAVV